MCMLPCKLKSRQQHLCAWLDLLDIFFVYICVHAACLLMLTFVAIGLKTLVACAYILAAEGEV